ncbi:polysaccharide deacetylase family protein [Chitinophaga sancti]|uniref:Peptidoglycan/xylan/chitin deacetylase, PgdA/CDA1 family n=1 Tax=Chitinophaga sancti TaxID=1004 RepID=A0A1K1Q9D4_9BACT|nr:polysaccharide deacetylase family protein [Chitinophaga sancti]WQD61270.1 polysaccharide deacetylase family protein [Chitinophaga sancti]WQG86603.1 polysaccharide deacetylase family protein [Chitinophaga sancti]SFW56560.1 Peptidoglycan/xylan/chitin deacetylase, PgdA/CDA1 family [Chitinophaga sancti]
MNKARILIGIDLEELSLQAGKGQEPGREERLQVSREGLDKALTILDRYQLRGTFFITAAWAQAYPEMVRQLARRHEIAAFGNIERNTLEQVIAKRIYGCRMPVGTKPDYSALKAAGYLYHSGGQQVKPMTIEGGIYEIYAGSVRPLWVTKFFLGRAPVISLHFSSRELGTQSISRAGNPGLAARLDSVLSYLSRKGQFMPHIEWLQEQLSDD